MVSQAVTCEPFAVLRGHVASVSTFCFQSEDILISGDAEGWMKIWDVPSRRSTLTYRLSEHGLLCIKLLDDHTLAVQSRDGYIRFYDPNECFSSCFRAVVSSSYTFTQMAVASTQCVAIPAADPSQVDIFEREQSSKCMSLKETTKTGMAMALRWNKEGQLLAVAYENGGVGVWDIRMSDRPLIPVTSVAEQTLLCMDFNESFTKGVAAGPEGKVAFFDVNLQETSLQVINTVEASAQSRPGIADLCLRPDEKLLATGGWDHRVRLFHWKKMGPLALLKFHSATVNCVKFCPTNPEILGSCSQDERIALWKFPPEPVA